MRSNASSVSTSPSVARIAANWSTLAASVPPMPPMSATSSVISRFTRSATSAEKP